MRTRLAPPDRRAFTLAVAPKTRIFQNSRFAGTPRQKTFTVFGKQHSMTDATLYAELKPHIESLAVPLIDFSKQCIRNRGGFLPHAAILTAEGKVELIAAWSGHERTNAAEILPLLHEGLRARAQRGALAATGVAESVTITLPGEPPAKAIKVLFEHRRGLTVALYVPYEEHPGKGLAFNPAFSMLADPEVKAFQEPVL
jgi:hypothetical protein